MKNELEFSSHALEMLQKRQLQVNNTQQMLRITRGNAFKFGKSFPHITNKFRTHIDMDFALVDKNQNVALMCAGNTVVTAMYADGAWGYNF